MPYITLILKIILKITPKMISKMIPKMTYKYKDIKKALLRAKIYHKNKNLLFS
jgi:hypothetical protein